MHHGPLLPHLRSDHFLVSTAARTFLDLTPVGGMTCGTRETAQGTSWATSVYKGKGGGV
jgi:hypothetical protein